MIHNLVEGVLSKVEQNQFPNLESAPPLVLAAAVVGLAAYGLKRRIFPKWYVSKIYKDGEALTDGSYIEKQSRTRFLKVNGEETRIEQERIINYHYKVNAFGEYVIDKKENYVKIQVPGAWINKNNE